jgi:predicted DNA-binding transcriptional regulator AlpA
MHPATPSASAKKQKQTRNARRVGAAKRNDAHYKRTAERAAALLSGDGLLRLPEVLALVPVSPSTWWEGVRVGRFPQSIKVGPRCTCWRASDVRALIAHLGIGSER